MSIKSNNIRIKYSIADGVDEVVNRVIDAMNETFQESGILNNDKGSRTLQIDILQCTQGSKWARLCCDTGWVVLEVKWNLIAPKKQQQKETDSSDAKKQGGQGTVLCQGTKELRDAALLESDFPENTLLKTLAPKLAREIVDKIYPQQGKDMPKM